MYKANTLKMAGACAFLGMAVIATSVSGAHAEPSYDKKLAKFLADKAAATLGELRTGFTMDGSSTAAIEAAGLLPSERFVKRPVGAGAAGIDPTTTSSIDETSWQLPRTDIRVVYAG